MFNALDHLNGLQLIAVLSPIVIIMTFIKKREEKADSIALEDMNSLQKGWVFLSLLAPGLAARILNMMTGEERERMLKAGEGLKGSPHRVAYPVLETFFKAENQKGAPSKDTEELCRYLNLKYEDQPASLLAKVRKAYL